GPAASDTRLSERIFSLIKSFLMTQAQLSAMLESITGHLTVKEKGQEKQLQEARERVAASLVGQNIEDTGTERLFANSSLYSRDNISASALSNINDITAGVMRRPSAPEKASGAHIFVRS